jgi:hypothetical protein
MDFQIAYADKKIVGRRDAAWLIDAPKTCWLFNDLTLTLEAKFSR